MNYFASIWTVAKWEVKRSLSTMSREILPIAALLFVLLIAVTGFAAQSGIHLQDGMYRMGVSDLDLSEILTSDTRFSVYLAETGVLWENRDFFDIVILGSEVYPADTEKGRAALRALTTDYEQYQAVVYTRQEDLFAAYPLWIELQNVKSELDFLATQSGQRISGAPGTRAPPVPEGTVVPIPPPPPQLDITEEQLRLELIQSSQGDTQLSRYTRVLGTESGLETFKTPSQLAPPLPFDIIILVFVFIFPLYFTSQFFMMSIMNERIERRGEVLLSSPVQPISIIIGKALPFFSIMLGLSILLTLLNGLPLIIILPLVPVILFFLANALFIGMVSRSFKELSFLSIFFSTVATSYIFFPSIFANIHAVSYISPLTLIVLQIQGEGFSAADYLYSTALFYLTSAVLLYIATVNFNEERLFNQLSLTRRIRDFIAGTLSWKHPLISLFLLTIFSIPFVFMVQLMTLVLFFNLPMPLSLILLLISAAFIEELVKSIGIYAMFRARPRFFTARRIVYASFVVALGFLAGEKLLLFATLAQITESIFGSILFLSLQVLWMPLLLHTAGVLIVAGMLKIGGPRAYAPGLLGATALHCVYNIYIITGGLL